MVLCLRFVWEVGSLYKCWFFLSYFSKCFMVLWTKIEYYIYHCILFISFPFKFDHFVLVDAFCLWDVPGKLFPSKKKKVWKRIIRLVNQYCIFNYKQSLNRMCPFLSALYTVVTLWYFYNRRKRRRKYCSISYRLIGPNQFNVNYYRYKLDVVLRYWCYVYQDNVIN